MGKRATTKATPRSPAKKAKTDPAFATVSDAVLEADQIPDRVRTMLVEMLPFSLKFASDERHELQSMAVDMVEQTLSAKKAALEATVTTDERSLTSLKASRVNLGANLESAEAALTNQKNVVHAKKAALDAATGAENASNADLNAKREEHSTAEVTLATMQEDKTAIEGAIGEHFKPIEEGEGGKTHFKKLEPFLKQIEIESTLLTALPSTCGKPKDKRGSFDVLVLQELDKAFNVKIAALAASIAGEGPAKSQREAGIQAAEADQNAKKAAREQAASEYKGAEKEQCDRENALVNAKQAVEDFEPQLEERTAALENARVELADFEATPLANFHNLKTRVAAVPEEPAAEEPAAEEPAAEEPAAAEQA